MRIVTRPDFDGVVCAVLLYDAEHITSPVKWVSPNDMQKNNVEIHPGDIIANLPYHHNCALWFDHHFSNQIRRDFQGLFKMAPSAARLVFEYYQDRFQRDYTNLVAETDKIDAADLSLEEILHPEDFPFVMLSMTIQGHIPSDEAYWNKVIHLLRKKRIQEVISEPDVQKRCRSVIRENEHYITLLEKHTTLLSHVAITDFRTFDAMPYGNRFLVYSMFPEASVSMKIGFSAVEKDTLKVKIGHSIINKSCRINIGQMLSYFEGGGHRGAGSCSFHVSKADEYLPRIIDILQKNEPEGSIVVKVERSRQDRRADMNRRTNLAGGYENGSNTDRRKKERRINQEQRKKWKRVTEWKSVPLTK